MRQKSFRDIRGLDPDFVEKIIDEYGEPDFFLESAEASLNVPDPHTDPEARRIVDGLDKEIKCELNNYIYLPAHISLVLDG